MSSPRLWTSGHLKKGYWAPCKHMFGSAPFCVSSAPRRIHRFWKHVASFMGAWIKTNKLDIMLRRHRLLWLPKRAYWAGQTFQPVTRPHFFSPLNISSSHIDFLTGAFLLAPWPLSVANEFQGYIHQSVCVLLLGVIPIFWHAAAKSPYFQVSIACFPFQKNIP